MFQSSYTPLKDEQVVIHRQENLPSGNVTRCYAYCQKEGRRSYTTSKRSPSSYTSSKRFYKWLHTNRQKDVTVTHRQRDVTSSYTIRQKDVISSCTPLKDVTTSYTLSERRYK